MLKLIITAAVLVSVSYGQNANVTTAKDRAFSIFSVVNFPNTQCTTMSSANSNPVMFGTCMSSDECSSKSGTADGNCASGFGVCCMFLTSSCGSVISINNSYIQNPNYPTAYNERGSCSYTFNADVDICQIRLDFDVMQLRGPSTTAGSVGQCSVAGDATLDQFQATSPTGYNPPAICGLNTGTHMYIETGKEASPAAMISFNIGSGTTTRNWKIRVTQIECFSNYRAPGDCVQYFTGVTGSFQSYNFNPASPQILASQSHSYCIRQERGFCSVDLTALPNNFGINAGNAKRSRNGCSASHLLIRSDVVLYPDANNASPNTDLFCGGFFSTVGGNVENSVVPVTANPFVVSVFTANAAQNPASIGFKLEYAQKPC